MIKEIKNKLSKLTIDSMGLLLISFGVFIVVTAMSVYAAIEFGPLIATVAVGMALMTMGIFISFL